MGACPRLRAPAAVAIYSVPLAHALVSSDDEVWWRGTPRGSRFRESPPPRPALEGAEADGLQYAEGQRLSVRAGIDFDASKEKWVPKSP